MTLFESLLILLLIAVLLLQLARRFSLPYPAMLAGAGIALALIPMAPSITIDPATSLALFIAPAIVNAAYDYSPAAARRFRAPIVTYAIFAVILTAIAVALVARWWLGIPLAAGMVVGAIVAPPDAAAAAAILQRYRLPRRTDAVLNGESLLNDATALLLFGGGLIVVGGGGFTLPVGLRLGLAPAGGLVLGVLCAFLVRAGNRAVRGTLGGTLFQFVASYLVWVLAQHLRLSAVLCEIAFAVTLARTTDRRDIDTRMRVQSYAVWDSVVFTLNVCAFLLMGMQARRIVLRTSGAHLHGALIFAAAISLVVIVVRFVVVLAFTCFERWWQRGKEGYPVATPGQAFFVGWCGMRGFVTVATALALPDSFPQRDTAVLTAFFVVVATLVMQGLTVTPLVRILHLDRTHESQREEDAALAVLSRAALASLKGEHGPEADNIRYRFSIKLSRQLDGTDSAANERLRGLGLKAVAAQRAALDDMRNEGEIDSTTYIDIQEQLDWHELALSRDADRRIEEI